MTDPTLTHQERQRQYCREYYNNHREELIRKAVERKRLNKDKYNLYQREYRRKQGADKRLRNTIRECKRHKRVKLEAFALLGGVCKHCGFADHRALQIDHIAGVSSEKRERTVVIYSQICKGSTAYQLLCANCNWIKRYENNEAPLRV